ncbi:hypothetical protein LXA43DRAFT_1122306 [Ganoderma leucocontextum]|nr:hypothetical protein LXA43DRAFT_1122306 [Ganoderma leucocontextum]
MTRSPAPRLETSREAGSTTTSCRNHVAVKSRQQDYTVTSYGKALSLKSTTLQLKLRKHVQMRRPSGTQSTVAPVFTLTTSEYWNQSKPDVLHREIARRVAEPRAKQEIAKALSCERLEFKVLWNRSLDINQLPNELLIQIFKFHTAWLPHLFDVTAEGRRETPNGRFWRLMRVCRHWREVIVGTPAFWCSVLLKKATNWTELCLARSVAAPIEVIADMPLWCRIEHLTVVYPLIHRIGSLYFGVQVTAIGILEPDVLATVPLLFGNGMPGLERLHFAITHDRPSPYHLPIDVELTCQRFPHLRRLALTGIVAPQDASFYTQLQKLSLTTCTHHLSFDHFLDTLASCTGLKLLHLHDTVHRLSAGDWMQRDPGPPYRRSLVSFPHLDRFVLSGHRPACTSRFLAYFHIHSSTSTLVIAADAEDQQADLPPDGACSMAAMFPPSHAVTLEPLAMAKDIEMAMCEGPSVEIHTRSTLPAFVRLMMQLGPDDHRAPPSRWGSVADLVQFLGRSPLTSLSVFSVRPDAVAAWAGVFRTFPLLERLSLWGIDDAVGKENAFLGLHAASTAGADPDSDSPTVACPNLKHVRLHGLGSTELYEAIRICFRHRGERGFVLAGLDLELW